jgi:hypothetical protein
MNGFYLSDAAPISPQMWLVVAVAMLTIIYAVFLRPMLRQRKDPLEKRPGQGFGSLARQREAERQMETLLVELTEMARQITAQLDTRAAKLQELLRQADEAIEKLKAPPQSRAAVESAAEDEEDRRHADVYTMADQGLDSRQIAQRLARPSGEIELILALRSGKRLV